VDTAARKAAKAVGERQYSNPANRIQDAAYRRRGPCKSTRVRHQFEANKQTSIQSTQEVISKKVFLFPFHPLTLDKVPGLSGQPAPAKQQSTPSPSLADVCHLCANSAKLRSIQRHVGVVDEAES